MQTRFKNRRARPTRPHVERLRSRGRRTLVAVLENGQQADGSVTVPEALVAYMTASAR